MDPDKAAFLFGTTSDDFDPDDADQRGVRLAEQLGIDGVVEYDGANRFRLGIHEAIAAQIADNEPPEAWGAVQRMLAAGVGEARAMGNLVLAFTGPLRDSLVEKRSFDEEAYLANLAELPLPTPEAVDDALVAITRDRQPIDADELLAAATERFGGVTESLLGDIADRALDDLMEEDVLAYVADDLVVHVPSLLAHVVLTHTINDAEIATDVLAVAADLPAFADPHGPVLVAADGSRFGPFTADRGHVGWRAPDGWLAALGEGTTIAVRMPGFAEADWYADELAVDIEVLGASPPVDPDLVAALRAAYDAGTEESGIPALISDVLLDLVAEDRSRFATPAAPLTVLCDAAGLERRTNRLAHDPEQWARHLWLRRLGRLHGWFDGDDPEVRDVAIEALTALDRARSGSLDHDPTADGPPAREVDPRRALAAMHRDPGVLVAVTLTLLGDGGDHESEADAVEVAESILSAAHRPGEAAVAHWVAALSAERQFETLEAEEHLKAALVADRDFKPALDRLAWYHADRGEAREALRLWNRVSPEAGRDDRRVLRPFAGPGGPTLGRNEPCWCGSGRKYKQCHQGASPLAPLPDRVGWLCRKAVGFLERRYLQPPMEILELAAIRAGSEEHREIAAALDDPLVMDVALHEEGGFAEFLAHRGLLLPDDEHLLARSWTLVDRTVHEVVGVAPESSLTLRDLRTGDVVEVRERSLTRQVSLGTLLCCRAVPDGEQHQLIGGVFVVAPGTETTLLDILDDGDGRELLAYRARLDAPPRLHSREGEVTVSCRATVSVVDVTEASAALDRLYEHDDADVWVEWHHLDHGERIVRAWLRFDDSELVVEAMSEERMDRVLGALADALPESSVTSDHREPFDARAAGSLPPEFLGLPQEGPHDPELDVAMAELQDQMERRWCDESVPALGG